MDTIQNFQKVITCTGFGGTGSSSVSDLMKEFSNVKSMGDFEFSLAHEVDGISDLQHSIVEDFHRNKTTEAFYRFRRLIKKISPSYDKIFSGKFSEYIGDYIESLVDYRWKGFWHQHVFRYGKVKRMIYYTLPYIIQMKFGKLFNRTDYEFVPRVHSQMMEIGRNPERFFLQTKKLYEKLFDQLNPERKFKFIHLDQLVPPHNYNRYLRYFNDLKIVQVDRDPRDLYLLNELFWHEGWIPSKDVRLFIDWYKLLRQNNPAENNSERVLRIQFEDFIYNYESTIKNVCDFIGLCEDEHVFKKQFFNPEKSIKNTKLFDRFETHKAEINLIEQELSEYCYSKW